MSDWNDGPPERFERALREIQRDFDIALGDSDLICCDDPLASIHARLVQLIDTLPGPAQPERSESPWSRFLQSRMDCIAEWDRGGQSAVQILDTLTPDLGQIQLLISNARSKPMFTCRKPDEDGEPMSATNLARDDLRGQVLAYSRNETNYHRVADAMDTYAAAVRADERAKLESSETMSKVRSAVIVNLEATITKLRAKLAAETQCLRDTVAAYEALEREFEAMEQAHKARLRKEVEIAWFSNSPDVDAELKSSQLDAHLRSRGLEEEVPNLMDGLKKSLGLEVDDV